MSHYQTLFSALGMLIRGAAVDPGNFASTDPVSFFYIPTNPNYYTFDYTPTGLRYGAGTLTYKATINDPDYMFYSATVGLLGAGNSGIPPTIHRTISLTESGALMTPATLSGTSGTQDPPAYFTPGVTVANFSTTWYIPVGESISALNNQMQIQPVPAPLPILGAIAAFGWSRKLRRRIRDASKSDQN